MSRQNFVTKNAIRIGEDWGSFLNEHPELRVRQRNGKVAYIMLPEEADHLTFVILNGEVAYIKYFFNEEWATYTSLDAHESKIDKSVEKYDKNCF